MVEKGRGFLGIITEGAEEAVIKSGLKGYIVDYNRTGASFTLRKPGWIFLSRTKNTLRYDQSRIDQDRAVRFIFADGPDCDYTTLASKYSQYLTEKLEVEKVMEAAPINLRIFCGITERRLLSNVYIAATTFDQVLEMLKVLRDKGINDIILTLIGWEKGGYRSGLPYKLPVDSHLGGKRGLEALILYTDQHDIPVFLETDYLQAIHGNGGFSKDDDVIKYTNQLPFTDADKTFLLSPVISYNNFAKKEFPRFKDLGIDGIHFSHLGDHLISDHSEKHYLDRKDSLYYYLKMFQDLREMGMLVSVEGANSYSFPFADYLYSIPLTSSRYVKDNREIPFFQISLHGIKPYYGNPINLQGDLQLEILKMLEYGSLPVFELTYQDPVVFKDTLYNHLFSSEFDAWLPFIEELYFGAYQDMKFLLNKFVVKHTILVKGVNEVVYDDGSILVVNYLDSGYDYNGTVIEAFDYLLLKP